MYCCCCCLVTKSCQTVSNPVNCSSPRFPVLHDFLESAQTYVHWVGNAVQLSHCLFPPSPPGFSLPEHQSYPISWLFTSGGQRIGASASVLPINIQGLFPLILLAVQGTLKRILSAPQFESINSLVLSLLHCPTLTSIHDYWKTIVWLYKPWSTKWCLCFLIHYLGLS